MNRVLAIDPSFATGRTGSRTGLAYFVEGQLTKFGHLTAEEVANGSRHVWLAQTDHLVIESQFHGPNVKVLIGLVEAKCRWTVPARDRGVGVTELSPQAWQKAVTRNWRFGVGSKKDPAAIEQYVRRRWALKGPLTLDEQSAICLGTVYLDATQSGAGVAPRLPA